MKTKNDRKNTIVDNINVCKSINPQKMRNKKNMIIENNKNLSDFIQYPD